MWLGIAFVRSTIFSQLLNTVHFHAHQSLQNLLNLKESVPTTSAR
ncbi:unnamed protein product [Haemonchus placei]|uniref:Uncharacterized protein n=1 Tax=Haemonchus placei TaxID=6290 RepID=A0A0N4VYB0_HAEPC|nr:unnamed protein product [Haemonchus placei]